MNLWLANVLQLFVLSVIVILFGKSVGNYSARDKICTEQVSALFLVSLHFILGFAYSKLG
jgi:hypothetical protein